MARPEAIYLAAFEQSSMPLAVVDGRGLLAVWNEAFESIFRAVSGLGPERLKGSLFDFVAEREGARLDYYAAQILLGGGERAAVDSPVRAADGTRRWLRFSLSLLEAEALGALPAAPGSAVRPDGPPRERYLLCSAEDATDRVLRERRLREAKDEAEKATHTKSQFLANMSHEIRTPIQTILGVVELLQETSLDGEQAEYAAQVRFSADVLLGLINDILDFSKIEAGKLDLETADFDLRACVGQSVDMLVMEAHRKGLEVLVDIDEELPALVRGDPARLRQIIVNLFKNAVKFTREGGVSLVVRRAQGGPGGPPLARFEVVDTGIGIPEAVREKLFTPFFQADFAAARKAGGTGLGLAISRHLAELMGGTIGVRPGEGSGSVFFFEIPLVAPEYSAPPRPAPARPGTRVLVVDDHPGARSFAARTARSAGFEVAEAGSGEEALRSLREAAAAGEPYSLVLVDQNMPRMDGWRLASEITGDTAINGARLILMAGEGTMGADAKMKLLGWFNAYITKPVKPRLLLEALERAELSDVDLPPADAEPRSPGPSPTDAEGGEAAAPERFDAEVLVAEDHEVNRELFTTILDRLGCRVVSARDGVEAVEIGSGPRDRPFDIVLMDIFMPRMNGYEASRALRDKGYRGPIVAVTASALRGEREKCVLAGMDDILVKPFKKRDLALILARWLPSGTRRMADAAGGPAAGTGVPLPSPAGLPPSTEASAAAAAGAAQDREVFDWEGVLDTFLGQEDTVKGLLGRFTEKARVQVEELAAALEARDWTRFREVAHSLKGASWNLSARRLGDAALAAESAGRAGDPAAAAEALARARPAFAEFAAAARARLAES